MTTNYGKLYSKKSTPQWQSIPGSGQVPNSAGGFAWPVDDWTRLDRFLMLGSEKGSYYASERALTRGRDPVHELVRPLLLRDGRAPRQPALDQARQDRVDLALRRAPEVVDAPRCQSVELVTRGRPERQEAEQRVLGEREPLRG